MTSIKWYTKEEKVTLIEDLENLKQVGTEGLPFNSLIDFEQWSNHVSPLLSFDKKLKNSFDECVTSGKITFRTSSKQYADTNMNKAIGILNQAIVTAKKGVEYKELSKKKELLPPEKLTIYWLLKHIEIKHWLWVSTLAGSIFTAGAVISEAGIYKNAKKMLFPKEVTYVKASGALILGCKNKKPAMLGVLHDEDGSFVFSPPAGRSNEGETERITAIRETKEETGYSIIPRKNLGFSPEGNTFFSLVLAEIDNSKSANSHYQEVVGLLWANPKNIPKFSWRFPEQREWVIELFEENAPGECP